MHLQAMSDRTNCDALSSVLFFLIYINIIGVSAFDSDSSVEAEAAGNHLCSSSGPTKKEHHRV